MATDEKNLKLARVTEAAHSAFMASVPASGSVYFDEAEKTIRIGDGKTAGGVRIASDIDMSFVEAEVVKAKALAVRNASAQVLAMSAKDNYPARLGNSSSFVSQINPLSGTNWVSEGLGAEDFDIDPWTGDAFLNASGTGKKGTMYRLQKSGANYVAVSRSASEAFAHQGNCLYRPTPTSKHRWFCMRDHKLSLKEWDLSAGSAVQEVAHWEVVGDEFVIADSFNRGEGWAEVVYTNITPTLSPDQTKLMIRLVRKSDGKLVFKVLDVAKLLANPGTDMTNGEDISIEEPDYSVWSNQTHDYYSGDLYDISRQSVAFDGKNIYCMDSHTGNSSHFVVCFDLTGKKVFERSTSIEGKDKAELGNYEGESISFCRGADGEITLMLCVSVFDTTTRNTFVYDITAGNVPVTSPLVVNYYGAENARIASTSNYAEFRAQKDVLIKAGAGGDYSAAIRFLANASYKALACDPASATGTIVLGRPDRHWGNVYTDKLTIGNTALTEAQLQSLLAKI